MQRNVPFNKENTNDNSAEGENFQLCEPIFFQSINSADKFPKWLYICTLTHELWRLYQTYIYEQINENISGSWFVFFPCVQVGGGGWGGVRRGCAEFEASFEIPPSPTHANKIIPRSPPWHWQICNFCTWIKLNIIRERSMTPTPLPAWKRTITESVNLPETQFKIKHL